jgi:N-acyl-L-homoserine lactone synthetase
MENPTPSAPSFRGASTPEDIARHQQFRHLVFVQQRRYLPGSVDLSGREVDDLDAHSVLVLAEVRGEVAGSSRLTLLRDCKALTERLFALPPQDIPREHLGEISRFAVAKEYQVPPTGRLIRFGLYRLLTELALERDIRFAYISLLPRVDALLKRDGIPLSLIRGYRRLGSQDGGLTQLETLELTPYMIDMREAHKVLHDPSDPP